MIIKLILVLFTAAFLLLPFYLTPATSAQVGCGSATSARAEGLVTTPLLPASSKFGTTGSCIIDPKAAFAPFKIPGFDDLKSLYYDQSKLSKSIITVLPSTFSTDGLYLVNGDLTVSSSPGISGTGGTEIIFVTGNLNITGNYCYGAANCLSATQPAPLIGTVFVVKGNINVEPPVQRIDAVLISEGRFCSIIQPNGTTCKSPGTDQQLVINGSIISLNQDKPPFFARSLADNSIPAELINHQVKYLVILRNLMSDTLQRWSEIP